MKRTPLRRTKPIRPRGKRMFKGPEYEDPKYLDYIRSLPCTVFTNYGCMGRIDPHHVKTKGAGGKDRGNTIPLCRLHHNEWGDKGRTSFQMKYKLDAPKEAKLLMESLEST